MTSLTTHSGISLYLRNFSKFLGGIHRGDGRSPVGYRDQGRPALGLFDQAAEELGKGLFAHELLHLGDGDEGLLEDVVVPSGVGGADHGFLVCVLAIRAALHQLEAVPL